ncbi:unnamed protein product [Calypogeia fissa]
MMSPGLMIGAGGSATHNNMAPVLDPAVHPVVQDNSTPALDHLMCLRRSEIDKVVEREAEKRRPKRRNVKVSTDPQSVAARIRREKIALQCNFVFFKHWCREEPRWTPRICWTRSFNT